jgi:predicted component of type VI protein secretion system
MSPEAVARRLQQLSELYVPETVEEARVRFDAERPRRQEDFNSAVARRLEELRALCELTRALQGKAKSAR